VPFLAADALRLVLLFAVPSITLWVLGFFK
jgi:hypothetical protein